ncbi:hypothetical protein [Burkholderia latens]|uniref:hypothetical protein n=1 Tax=Burkholderia latens TaxID=488446 RepID=UPI001AE7FB95|nr:hypothetical protein [Burkholderia latens]QTO46383.1 hypothetical protein J8I85_18245 [Burkholderia latens]
MNAALERILEISWREWHMTDEEARKILKNCNEWITWDERNDIPDWSGGEVVLDGFFTAEELHAILHFLPKE